MDARIVFTHPNDGKLAAMAPCPGARLVTKVKLGLRVITVATPARLEHLIGIVTPAKLATLTILVGETDQEFAERLAARKLPPGTPWAVKHRDQIPRDKFWAQRSLVGQALVLSIAGARQQVLDEVRQERNRRLLASDQEKNRLDDVGSAEQKAALATYRQALRDLPVSVLAELAALVSAADLAAYAPTWPAAPA